MQYDELRQVKKKKNLKKRKEKKKIIKTYKPLRHLYEIFAGATGGNLSFFCFLLLHTVVTLSTRSTNGVFLQNPLHKIKMKGESYLHSCMQPRDSRLRHVWMLDVWMCDVFWRVPLSTIATPII
jgi:hypothetical protein